MKNFIRSILLCFVLFFSINAGSCFEKTIDVVSNASINSDKAENKMTPSISNLLEAVKQFNYDASDSVVFIGNNIHSPNRHDCAMFAKIIEKINKNVYVVLGNKDVSKTKSLNKKEYYRILNKYSNNLVKDVPSCKKDGELIYIFLYGVNETFSLANGYYKNYELVFLDDTLTKFSDKKAIIFQHFPVVSPDELEIETVKPEKYIEVLKKHDNVLAVVSGYYDKENSVELDNVKHISIGSLSSSNEYEQIKIYKNKNGSYSITTKVLSVKE